MRVTLVPSAPGTHPGTQDATRSYLTTFVVDDVLAIDAGCLGLHGEPDDQARIDHVFLTHSHADHTGTLPVFVENVYPAREQPVVVHGHSATLQALRTDVFNDRIWPDFVERLPGEGSRSFLELRPCAPGKPVQAGPHVVTPVPVDHVVPTYGYLVDDGADAVVFGGDSGPTEALWDLARQHGRVRAVFLECSFPDELAGLAEVSAHLTPRLLAAEAAKAPPGAAIVAVHIKPRYRRQIVAELEALGLPRLRIGAPGETLAF